MYDSREDTLKHIARVQAYLELFALRLKERGTVHDNSKLEEPEKAEFDRLTPILAGLTYGSPEYNASKKELGEALKHHYENNSHHPEHYTSGINGMDLLDVVEMFCDWKAASERMSNGDISRSIDINKDRFAMSEQLESIFKNTVESLGW